MKRLFLYTVFFFCTMSISFAQLCTGSLGDPVVNNTFGSNARAALKPGVTNMTYTSLVCPSDGEYTIANTTSGCFSDTWHTIKDHTGDNLGQFMLINASVTPSDFYVDTVRGLCSNTNFEFAAWVVNMLRPGSCISPSRPNLTFRIETTAGALLAKYESGDINASAQPVWKQFGTFFKTPAGVTDVVLRITNNAPGGCGNDLAIDDITFRPCGETVLATVRNQSANVISCEADKQVLTFDASTANGFSGYILQWQLSVDGGSTWTDIAGAQSASYTRPATPAGIYLYRVVVAEAANFSSVKCRVASNIITVTVKESPAFPAQPAVRGCVGAVSVLSTVNVSGYTYQWSGPNNFSGSSYKVTINNTRYTDSGMYRVTVQTADGCRGADSVYLDVFPNVLVTINNDTTICEGGTAQLSASGGSVYNWSPVTALSNSSIANPSAKPVLTTMYTTHVTNTFGCTDSAHTTVTVINKPIVNAGADKIMFEGESLQLDASITGNITGFYWSPITSMLNAGTLTPTVSPAENSTYTLYANSSAACPAVSDAVFIQVYKNVAVPNAFSPNADGINDTWIIKGIETYPTGTTRVYTRTGQLVFETRAANKIWDGNYNGKPVPVATYYYVIDLNIGSAPLSGWVFIVR